MICSKTHAARASRSSAFPFQMMVERHALNAEFLADSAHRDANDPAPVRHHCCGCNDTLPVQGSRQHEPHSCSFTHAGLNSFNYLIRTELPMNTATLRSREALFVSI